MKVSIWWVLLVLTLSLAAAYLFFKYIYTPSETITISKRGKYDVVTMALPNDPNPKVFGPKYWESYHKLTENIPCPSCRNKAVPFMKFFHDVVNVKTEKDVVYPDNFNQHIDMICNLKKA